MTQKHDNSSFHTSVEFPNAAWMAQFRRRILAWFRRNARDLPWRRTRDPYAIWVSEIMLQQTQVVTVIGYFERFLAAFPSIADLAAADEQQVLRLWEGLGYYRRARQLHAAARVIVAEHQGRFPRDPEQIRALPGIGRYTAGAIASIGWDAREPILEANTIRVFSRLLAYRGDPQKNAGQQRLWEFAAGVLPKKDTGLFNQALMELGSEICTPRGPLCDQCPVRTLVPDVSAGAPGGDSAAEAQDQVRGPSRSGRHCAPRRPCGASALRSRRTLGGAVGLSAIPRYCAARRLVESTVGTSLGGTDRADGPGGAKAGHDQTRRDAVPHHARLLRSRMHRRAFVQQR